jgi:pimeloyl-ACP methyl ester carboxylesterase
MVAQPFEVPVDGGALHGHRGGSGRIALLLHGGAAVPDYLDDCAAALDGLFQTIRYTQRGTPPSGGDPPYTVEAHVADAVRVLDALGIERAWAIGHSWGGHLALHLAVTHPDRLAGLLLIDPLGADPAVFPELDENLRRHMTVAQRARLDEIEQRRRDGAVPEAELVERFALVWPQYFVRPEQATAPPGRVGVQASIEVNRSLADHFARRTLQASLPGLRLPVAFVHGDEDPLPLRSTRTTAELIPGARLESIPDCGHFPWVEQPGVFRRAVERLMEGT